MILTVISFILAILIGIIGVVFFASADNITHEILGMATLTMASVFLVGGFILKKINALIKSKS